MRYIASATEMRYRNTSVNQHPDKTVVTMFYEPSTRTSCSFQAAAFKLGCNVINLTEKMSSVEKGESLEDTIQTLGFYGDAIVLRHPSKGSAERAAAVSRVPIINAGDGNGEHPTQALLDIYTIYTELLSRGIDLDSLERDHLTITFVGDLKNGRTVHSLIRVLLHFPNLRFVYVSPDSLEMPDEIVSLVSHTNRYEQNKMTSLEEAIITTDVLYMTRIQKERFVNTGEYDSRSRFIDVVGSANTQEFTDAYYCGRLNLDTLQFAKEKMIIMHPLPRLDEISPDVDSDHRAVYFKQVENGLYVRMAILDRIFRQGPHRIQIIPN